VGICGAPDDANGDGFLVIASAVVGFVDIRPTGPVTCCCAIKNAHICCCCSKVSCGIPDSAGGAPTVSCGALAAIIGAPVTDFGAPSAAFAASLDFLWTIECLILLSIALSCHLISCGKASIAVTKAGRAALNP
jgi:hypothetical protein